LINLKFILTKGWGEFFNVRYIRYSGYNVVLNFEVFMEVIEFNKTLIKNYFFILLSYLCDRL